MMEEEQYFNIIGSGLKNMSVPQIERLKNMCEKEIGARKEE